MHEHYIYLNYAEVILLTEKIKNDDALRKLTLKLASFFLEMVTEEKPNNRDEYPLGVVQSEIWTMLKTVSIRDRHDDDPQLGLKLLRKLYKLLIEMEYDDIEHGDVEDMTYFQATKQIKREDEVNDA